MQTIYNRTLTILVKTYTDSSFNFLLRNTSWLFLGNTIDAGIGFVCSILLARTLGVENLGILGIITSFTNVMGQFFDSRSWETSIKFLSLYESKNDHHRSIAVIKLGYLIDIISSILSFLLTWSLSNWIAVVLLGDTTHTNSIRIYALVLLFNWNGGVQALARIFNQYALIVKIQIGLSIFKLVNLIIITYLFESGLNKVLALEVFVSFSSLIIGIITLQHFVKNHFTIKWREAKISALKDDAKEIFRFIFSTNLTQAMKIVQRNGAVLALGFLGSPVQVGYYRLALSFAQQISLIYNPVFQSVYPEFSKLWAKNQINKLKKIIYKLLIFLGTINILIVSGALLWGKYIIELAVGKDYYPAFNIMILLIIVHSVAGTLIWVGPLLLATDHPGHQTIAVAAGSAMMLVCLFFAIPLWGAEGAAIAGFAFYLVWGSIAISKILVIFRKRYILKEIK
jgi:O-antigen/teichoic acid export membrane protein